MKRLFFVALSLAVTFAVVGADDQPAEKADDTQDVLYLGEGRPAMLRLKLTIDGKSVFEKWDAWMKRLFAFLDRNNTGALERLEAAKAPNAQQLLQFLQGDIATIRGRTFDPSVKFELLDADRDAKVTFEEFCEYYRTNGAGPVQVVNNARRVNGQVDNLTEVLFGQLDLNKDGKLSLEEVLSAERVLARLDTTDDELISPEEMGAPEQTQDENAPVSGPGPAKEEEPKTKMVLIPRDDGRRRTGRLALVREIVAKMDKDKSSKLSIAESGFPKAMFDKLDRNRDGQLDVIELGRWISGKPDGEFTVKLGSAGAMMRTVTDRAPAKRPKAADAPGMVLKLENVRLTVEADNLRRPPLGRLQGELTRQFRAADKDKKGFLIKKQLDPNQQFYLASLFDIADRNNDGKLTLEELKEFSDIYRDAYGAQVSLSLTAKGLGMFDTLDSNRDRQLGLRELRTCWERLKEYDTNGDGFVAKSEFPQQFMVSVGTGTNFANLPPAVMDGAYRPAVSQGRGPVWFRKMDRNGDGDISRKEWLGSQEEFERIDADRDGLLSAEEAEAADARARKKAD